MPRFTPPAVNFHDNGTVSDENFFTLTPLSDDLIPTDNVVSSEFFNTSPELVSPTVSNSDVDNTILTSMSHDSTVPSPSHGSDSTPSVVSPPKQRVSLRHKIQPSWMKDYILPKGHVQANSVLLDCPIDDTKIQLHFVFSNSSTCVCLYCQSTDCPQGTLFL